MSRLHPDDRDGQREAVAALLAGDGSEFSFDFRIYRQDGELRYIEGRGYLERDADGRPLRLIGTNRDVTDTVMAGAALREAKDEAERERGELDAIFNSMAEGVSVFDMEGNVIFVNSAEARICGYDRADEMLQDLDYYGRTFVLSRPDGADLPVEAWPVSRVLRGEIVAGVKLHGRRVDTGQEWEFWYSGTPVFGAQGEQVLALVITRDVTEEKVAHDQILEGKRRLELALEASNAAIWGTNLETGETFWDSRLETFPDFGAASGGETIAWLSCVHPADRSRVEAVLKATREDEQADQQIEFQVDDPDGQVRHFASTHARVVRADGQPWILGVLQDVTERRRREEQERQMQQRLQQTQRLESLGVLAGGIAHDFNNLLMAIVGHADLIIEELSPLSPVVEDVQNIKTSSMRAAELCAQLLAYSGKGKYAEESFSMTELVEEMAQMLKTSISKKCLLNLHLGTDLPMTKGDPSQMRQIIMNFVLNASEAVGERSGVISITTGAMDCSREYLANGYVLRPTRPGLYITLEVSDTGRGMDARTMERIFEPFFTTKFTGRGLGLSAVLGIIRSHDGGLRVYSEPGKGTTFKVLLPAVPDESSSPKADPAPSDQAAWRGEGTVLLVDDEESVRAISAKLLQFLGLDVMTARDGREAVEIYGQHYDEIDLVILDLTMPRMDGVEAYRELRRINPGRQGRAGQRVQRDGRRRPLRRKEDRRLHPEALLAGEAPRGRPGRVGLRRIEGLPYRRVGDVRPGYWPPREADRA